MTQTRNFAQDARYNEKMGFYVDLVKSLSAIAAIAERTDGAGGEAHRTGKGAVVGAHTAAPAPSNAPVRARARERVESFVPEDPKEAIGRLNSKEIRGMIRENCGLIKTVDKDMIPGIERRVKRIYEGTSRPDTLERYLENECDLEPWQAERIVRDQMQKYEARARLESMRKQGVKLVRWVHGDSHEPRPWHVKPAPYGLNGKVFPIDKPPIIDPATGERGWPGQLIGCKCHLEPVG